MLNFFPIFICIKFSVIATAKIKNIIKIYLVKIKNNSILLTTSAKMSSNYVQIHTLYYRRRKKKREINAP